MQLQLCIMYLFSFQISFVNACLPNWFPSLLDATKCYYVSQEQMSWSEAERSCRSWGGPNSHLTSVLSAFDANEIRDIAGNNPAITSTDQVWIGARGIDMDAKFEWLDGNQLSYTNWLAGQPNLLYPCVSTIARSSERWRTEPCETKNYFICKYFMQPTATPTDCYDYHFKNGNATTGIYTIYPSNTAPLQVFCEMEIDGGGWIVFQRRLNGNLTFFNKTWNEYKNGFNNGLENSFWLGNENIHLLSTKDASVDLRIDLWHDRAPNSTRSNGYWFEKHPNFFIGNETSNYTLYLSSTSFGNSSISGDIYGINSNVNMMFSTIDADHDTWASSCSESGSYGGWWFGSCTYVSLNGKYVPLSWQGGNGLVWYTGGFSGYYFYPAQSVMMLRKVVS